MKTSTIARIALAHHVRAAEARAASAAALRRVAKALISSSPNAKPPTCAQ